MNNRDRAINYVVQNYGRQLAASLASNNNDSSPEAIRELAARTVDHALEPSEYEKVSLYDLLTPGQRRRVKHRRSGVSSYNRQRERRQEQLTRKTAHWSELATLFGRR